MLKKHHPEICLSACLCHIIRLTSHRIMSYGPYDRAKNGHLGHMTLSLGHFFVNQTHNVYHMI
ncbi:hypothetical protein HanRHA438_Chr12g0543771 [Helianthus annuus]|nr:hypothetical protein HanRHA438_Chr12g0543771 [Helianthus annuus]